MQDSKNRTSTSADYVDYYAILGVKNTASHAEIQKAYHKLSLSYHADIKDHDTKDEKSVPINMATINAAYEILGRDPAVREQYDKTRSNAEGEEIVLSLTSDTAAGPSTALVPIKTIGLLSTLDIVNLTPDELVELCKKNNNLALTLWHDETTRQKLAPDQWSSIGEVHVAIAHELCKNEKYLSELLPSFLYFLAKKEKSTFILILQTPNAAKLSGEDLSKLLTTHQRHPDLLRLIDQTVTLKNKLNTYHKLLTLQHQENIPAEEAALLIKETAIDLDSFLTQSTSNFVLVAWRNENIRKKLPLLQWSFLAWKFPELASQFLQHCGQKDFIELGSTNLYNLATYQKIACDILFQKDDIEDLLTGEQLFNLATLHNNSQSITNPTLKSALKAYRGLLAIQKQPLDPSPKTFKKIKELINIAKPDFLAFLKKCHASIVLAFWHDSDLCEKLEAYQWGDLAGLTPALIPLFCNDDKKLNATSDLSLQMLAKKQKAACELLLKNPKAAARFSGEILSELITSHDTNHSSTILSIILDNPESAERLNAYKMLCNGLKNQPQKTVTRVITEKKPDTENHFYELGQAYLQESKTDLAINCFQKALSTNHPLSWSALVKIAIDKKDHSLLNSCLKKYIETFNDDGSPLFDARDAIAGWKYLQKTYNDLDARYYLARHFYQGLGVKKDVAAATFLCNELLDETSLSNLCSRIYTDIIALPQLKTLLITEAKTRFVTNALTENPVVQCMLARTEDDKNDAAYRVRNYLPLAELYRKLELRDLSWEFFEKLIPLYDQNPKLAEEYHLDWIEITSLYQSVNNPGHHEMDEKNNFHHSKIDRVITTLKYLSHIAENREQAGYLARGLINELLQPYQESNNQLKITDDSLQLCIRILNIPHIEAFLGGDPQNKTLKSLMAAVVHNVKWPKNADGLNKLISHGLINITELSKLNQHELEEISNENISEWMLNEKLSLTKIIQLCDESSPACTAWPILHKLYWLKYLKTKSQQVYPFNSLQWSIIHEAINNQLLNDRKSLHTRLDFILQLFDSDYIKDVETKVITAIVSEKNRLSNQPETCTTRKGAIKAEQYSTVIKDIQGLIREVALNHDCNNNFVTTLQPKLLERTEFYANSPIINGHRNYIAAFFKGLSGVILGLCSAGTLFAWKKFRDTFFHPKSKIEAAKIVETVRSLTTLPS